MIRPLAHDDETGFDEALKGLHHGDFDALAPVFVSDPARPAEQPPIVRWHAAGNFRTDAAALAEALTCACFLGATDVARYLLQAGVAPAGGSGTGMNAPHWAVNRGQRNAVALLLEWGAPLEVRNMHGTTVLGTAVWSALNEPRPEHTSIIEALLKAGARREDVEPVASYVEGRLRRLLVRRRVEEIESILDRRGAA